MGCAVRVNWTRIRDLRATGESRRAVAVRAGVDGFSLLRVEHVIAAGNRSRTHGDSVLLQDLARGTGGLGSARPILARIVKSFLKRDRETKHGCRSGWT